MGEVCMTAVVNISKDTEWALISLTNLHTKREALQK